MDLCVVCCLSVQLQMPWAPPLQQVPGAMGEGALHQSIHCYLRGFCQNRNPPSSCPNSIGHLFRCYLFVATPTLPLHFILCGLLLTTLISPLPLAYVPHSYPTMLSASRQDNG